jgi:peptidyl-prolyl cis-trans isomerase B (cyclophilin B)
MSERCTHLLPAVTTCGAVCLAALPSLAQLTPDRTYYGVDRGVPMTARVDPPAPIAGSESALTAEGVEIRLLEPGTTKVVAAAPAAAGAVDLATLFPDIWKTASPRLLYAQLVVGGRKLGPAVVLQPMISPTYAPRVDRSGAPVFPVEKERTRVFSGLRAYVDQNVSLETTKGRILIELRPEVAPTTCWWFRSLVEGGFYTDIIVHRIASLAGKPEADIIQTGDPNGTGQGGAGEYVDLEPSALPHDFGVISLARFSDPNSSSSQFMIGLNREGTAYLDRRYTSFGVVIAGAEVVRAIAASPVGADNRPTDPPVIRSAKLTDAAPYGEGPKPEPDPALRNSGR